MARDHWDIEDLLRTSDWIRARKPSKQGDLVYKKRFGQHSIELMLPQDFYGSALYLRINPPKTWTYEELQAQRPQYFRSVPFSTIDSVADIDVVAREMVAWRREQGSPRQRFDIEGFGYAREEGQVAYDEWVKDIRQRALELLRRQYRAYTFAKEAAREYGVKTDKVPWVPQRYLVQEILIDSEPTLDGITREQARRHVARVLRQMEREGILERLPPGSVSKQTEWMLDENYVAQHGTNVPLKKLKRRLLR